MGNGTRTKGTKQLFVEISEGLRERLNERVVAEQRTLRTVVERALAYYLDNVPLESAPVEVKPVAKKKK